MIALPPWALAAALVAQEPPVFTSEVDVVRVEVLVTRKGVSVAGLRAADFEVRDDGRVQEIEPVIEEKAPVDAVLVLDMSYSVAGAKLEALREGAAALLTGLEEGERAALLTFRQEVRLVVPLTPDVAGVRLALSGVSAAGTTSLRDAVYAALRLHEPGSRRSVVVVFSDGIDTASWLTAPAVVEAARRSEAIVYAVAARRAGDPEDPFLRDVTRATGGRLWTVSRERDLRERFLDVLRDIRARYVLSYVPQGVRARGWHALAVRLKGKAGDVLARPGYWRTAPAR